MTYIELLTDRSGLHSRLSNALRNMCCNTIFECAWNNVLCGEFIRSYKFSDGLSCSYFHIIVNISCAAI